jgi:hypothetical protein
VTTSEFDDVKARLTALHNRRRVDDKATDDGRPRLKKTPGGGTKPVEGEKGKETEDEDERPTLKRRT